MIDIFQKPKTKPKHRKASSAVGVFNKPVSSKSYLDTSFHEAIANTYLKTSEKKDIVLKKKLFWYPRIGLIGVIAFLAALAIVVSRCTFDIKITVAKTPPPAETKKTVNRSYITMPVSKKALIFLQGREPNGYIVRNDLFLGDARVFSRKTDKEVILCNTKGYGWANYTIELKQPVDLNRFDITYTAKGAKGDERLALVLVDTANRTYNMEKTLASVMTDEWKKYTVNFESIKNSINLANISIVRFEFGGLSAGNGSTATIFLKDVYLTKTKRMK